MASPISLNPGGGTLAQQALATAPEGMLIAPVWRRAAAFMTDVIVLSLLLHFLSGQQLLRVPFPAQELLRPPGESFSRCAGACMRTCIPAVSAVGSRPNAH